MKNRLNCPNCGAPITAEKCAYCGSVFLDFAAIQVGTPSYVKFKLGDAYVITKLVVTNLEITTPDRDSCEFHLDAHSVVDRDDAALLVTIVREGAKP